MMSEWILNIDAFFLCLNGLQSNGIGLDLRWMHECAWLNKPTNLRLDGGEMEQKEENG